MNFCEYIYRVAINGVSYAKKILLCDEWNVNLSMNANTYYTKGCARVIFGNFEKLFFSAKI